MAILVESDEGLARLLVELAFQGLIENVAKCPRLYTVDHQPEDQAGQQTKGKRKDRDGNPREKPA